MLCKPPTHFGHPDLHSLSSVLTTPRPFCRPSAATLFSCQTLVGTLPWLSGVPFQSILAGHYWRGHFASSSAKKDRTDIPDFISSSLFSFYSLFSIPPNSTTAAVSPQAIWHDATHSSHPGVDDSVRMPKSGLEHWLPWQPDAPQQITSPCVCPPLVAFRRGRMFFAACHQPLRRVRMEPGGLLPRFRPSHGIEKIFTIISSMSHQGVGGANRPMVYVSLPDSNHCLRPYMPEYIRTRPAHGN